MTVSEDGVFPRTWQIELQLAGHAIRQEISGVWWHTQILTAATAAILGAFEQHQSESALAVPVLFSFILSLQTFQSLSRKGSSRLSVEKSLRSTPGIGSLTGNANWTASFRF